MKFFHDRPIVITIYVSENKIIICNNIYTVLYPIPLWEQFLLLAPCKLPECFKEITVPGLTPPIGDHDKRVTDHG